MQVLEDGQAGHQPGGQRRPAGIIVVELAEARLEKAPVDHAREPRQRVSQVDDLIEPRPEKIRLATLASLLRSHRQNHPAPLNGGRERMARPVGKGVFVWL